MPILSPIGRKAPRIRALIIVTYVILTLGCLTTVYPFLMMLGSSFTSLTDFREHRVVARYIYDDKALMAKYLDDKYRPEQFDLAKLRYHIEEPIEEIVDGEKYVRKYGQFAQMEPLFSGAGVSSPETARRVDDYLQFIASVPTKYRDTFFHYRGFAMGEVQVAFQDYLKDKYHTIAELNKAYGDVMQNFVEVETPFEAFDRHTWYPAGDLWTADWEECRKTLPPYFFNVMMIRPVYQAFLQNSYETIAQLNADWAPGGEAVADSVGAGLALPESVVGARRAVPNVDEKPGETPDSATGAAAVVESRSGSGRNPDTSGSAAKSRYVGVGARLAPPNAVEEGVGARLAVPDVVDQAVGAEHAPPESVDDGVGTGLIAPRSPDVSGEGAVPPEAVDESVGARRAVPPYRYFWQIPFPLEKPPGPAGVKWELFVRKRIPLRFVRLDRAKAAPLYVEFLREKYATVEKYNGHLGDAAASFDQVAFPEAMPEDSLALRVWQEFYEQRVPLGAIILETPDVLYLEFVRGRFADVAALNAAYGTSFAAFEDVEPPYREVDFRDLSSRRSGIIRFFLTRNYVFVIKKIFLQGRPLLNTALLVLFIVGTAVTINPLAAYALSRYRLSYSANVLIFMLATMAFPAEVAMIPNFLMIKDLGLLNTFAALILPSLASGYSIFLLKGFFDSLPQELYEAATIDGASEFKMFWVITMPLSLPILSVIALFAFSSAYSSFIWSFTVCQDPRMWTLMVFLQQFQATSTGHPYLVMASLVLAAVPTIVVFLSAQKVLMRGIVVPTMK